jgi:hypothetical protein
MLDIIRLKIFGVPLIVVFGENLHTITANFLRSLNTSPHSALGRHVSAYNQLHSSISIARSI